MPHQPIGRGGIQTVIVKHKIRRRQFSWLLIYCCFLATHEEEQRWQESSESKTHPALYVSTECEVSKLIGSNLGSQRPFLVSRRFRDLPVWHRKYSRYQSAFKCIHALRVELF